jgi:3-hydroxybutyrate dehydrogenase
MVARPVAAAIASPAASAHVGDLIAVAPETLGALPYNIMGTAPPAGKCALITGSVRGLGLAAARRLAASGCHIAFHGLETAEETAPIGEDLRRHGVRSLYCRADLRRPDEIEKMVDDATATFGSIDILINNAVVRHVGSIEHFGTAEWEESLAVNLSAAFHTIRLAVLRMKQNRWGRIVNVSSIYGTRGATNRVGYVTSKTALIGLTRAVALETVSHGITCNAVCPGTSDTPVHDDTVKAVMAAEGVSREEAERRFFAGKQPSGRFIGADNVASLIAFLCGPEGADITGSVLPIDGGWSAT